MIMINSNISLDVAYFNMIKIDTSGRLHTITWVSSKHRKVAYNMKKINTGRLHTITRLWSIHQVGCILKNGHDQSIRQVAYYYMIMINASCRLHINIYTDKVICKGGLHSYRKCNFLLSPSVRRSVGWCDCWSVCQNFLKGREVTLRSSFCSTWFCTKTSSEDDTDCKGQVQFLPKQKKSFLSKSSYC